MRNLARLTLASLLFLGACGFTPIHATHSKGEPVVKALSAVAIDNIDNRHGQILRNKLIDRMYANGRPENPQALLVVILSSSEANVGVKKDATTSRSQLNLSASFRLQDRDGNEIYHGNARSVASYGKLDAQYGNVAAQRNAYDRALGEVGEQIVNALSLYYAEKAPQEKPKEKAATKVSKTNG